MLFISMFITGGEKGTERMSETALEWMNAWWRSHIIECHKNVEMNSEECNTIYCSWKHTVEGREQVQEDY